METVALTIVAVGLLASLGWTVWSWRRRMDPHKGGRDATKFFF